jgi:hypothetical protein
VDDEPIEILEVLDQDGLVEPELLGRGQEALPARLVTSAHRARRVVGRHEEDHERDERDYEKEENRPQDPPDQISEQLLLLL